MNKLRYVKRSQIDNRQWDYVADNAIYPLPYAHTWYLDAVAENWDALILNDYEAVMPLPWLRRYGIKCAYQPYYCQQLGVFSTTEISPLILEDFLNQAAAFFPYLNINLNPSAAPVSAKFGLVPRKNLLLQLSSSFSNLQSNFSTNHKRNIAKAAKEGLTFTETCNLKTFQNFYLENIDREKENFKPVHEKLFKKLSNSAYHQKAGSVFAATGADAEILAVAFLVRHKNRLISIINNSSVKGKKAGASHFLFNSIIHRFSGSNLLLDFEGSSVPSIARFYEGFGAQPEIFYNQKSTLLKKLGQRFS